MKLYIKKYFLTALALMLILSNFSFATTYMLCGMIDSDAVCSCKHKSHAPVKELTVSKVNGSCCKQGTAELSNNNLLSTVKIEQPNNISDFTPLKLNLTNLLIPSSSLQINITLRDQVPKDNILKLTSSLLI